MKRAIIAATLLTVLSATAAGPGIDETRLARVNGEPIRVARLLEDFRLRHGGHMSLLTGEDLLRRFLDSQIDSLLLVQEARRLEIDRDPRVVQKVELLERRKRIQALLQEEVDDRFVISDRELDEALERLRLRHRIRWVRLPTRELARSVRERAAAGESMEELALELSTDRSARSGGDPGPFGWGSGEPELERQVFALEPGELSEVFAVGDDFAVVMLEEREALAETPTGPEVERRVRGILRERKSAQLRRELVDSLIERADVEIDLQTLTPDAFRRTGENEDSERVAATIGETKLRLADLARALDVGGWPPMPDERFARRAAREVRASIGEMLVVEEARRRDSGGRRLEVELEALQAQTMLEVLLADYVHRVDPPTVEQLEEHYAAHAEEFRSPDRFHIRHIVVPEREPAESLRERLADRGDEAFASAARESSIDRDSAEQGGDLDWVPVTQLSERFVSLFSGMRPGELSPVLDSPLGFVIVRLVAAESGSVPEFDAVRDEVERHWLARARRDAKRSWIDQLRASSEVRVDEKRVQRAARRLKNAADHRMDPSGSPH